MIVVFDTNILVSALVFPGGKADEAVRRVLEGEDELVTSRELIRELLDVLARKFSDRPGFRDQEQLARVALFVAELGELVSPPTRVSVLADEDDNRVLECASAGDADLIVTGDRAMLALKSYEGTSIVRLRSYLEGQLAEDE